jgi:hypothetical protein
VLAGLAPAGMAASLAAPDPYPLDPGTYLYSYTVNSLTFQTDSVGEVGSASYFATDSRFTQPLWSLGISVQYPLISKADLSVDFESNAILGLNNSLIDSEVLSAISVSSGTAILNAFQLFNTSYPVDRTITYSEGVSAADQNAAIRSAPEPSALLLLLSGLAAMICLLRRVR